MAKAIKAAKPMPKVKLPKHYGPQIPTKGQKKGPGYFGS